MLNMAVGVVLVVRWKTMLALLDVWAAHLFMGLVVAVQVAVKSTPTVGMVEPGLPIRMEAVAQAETVLPLVKHPQ